MRDERRFYIQGDWVSPLTDRDLVVRHPADGREVGRIGRGEAADVDRAVRAARAAFPAWSSTSPAARAELLDRVAEIYWRRMPEMQALIREEMGAPQWLTEKLQAPGGWDMFRKAADALRSYAFEETHGRTVVRKEPIGVCAMITPWNWPATLVAAKVGAALAAGCTMVLKPSELAPLSAHLIAEILHEAGVPAGVFNLVDGLGPDVGEAMARHPDVDMVSLTGSARAGAAVAKAAADTIKRVTQELGGKSALIVLDDADFQAAVTYCVASCFANSGQTCLAPTRLLVPRARHDEAVAIACAVAKTLKVGLPEAPDTFIGPVVSEAQYERIQRMIEQAIEAGVQLAHGGPGKPEGLEQGAFVRPTIFAQVSNQQTIARDEVFGPVLCVLPYENEADAIAIANDSPYGLAGYVWGQPAHAVAVAAKLRTGYVLLNGTDPDTAAPFGGFKQSGNGREWGAHGLAEYLEIQSIVAGA